jgi:xanthine dehydrogenase YagT iron-sulfur-binding subunit
MDPGTKDPTRSGENVEQASRLHTESGGGLSRRGFLKGSGIAAAATALTTPLAEAVASPLVPAVVGPNPVDITLTINGQKKSLKVEPRVTLLDALRNQLDLTGAKKVCDRATCGACTVLIDGKAVYSCTVLAIEAQGRAIETVEGLAAANGGIARIQRCFVENDAQQCGFCTPGFVMACESFKRAHAAATREEVLEGLGGNLCRCGTYHGVAQAVLDAMGGA